MAQWIVLSLQEEVSRGALRVRTPARFGIMPKLPAYQLLASLGASGAGSAVWIVTPCAVPYGADVFDFLFEVAKPN